MSYCLTGICMMYFAYIKQCRISIMNWFIVHRNCQTETPIVQTIYGSNQNKNRLTPLTYVVCQLRNTMHVFHVSKMGKDTVKHYIIGIYTFCMHGSLIFIFQN